jgi:hypothetical protein
MQHVRGAPYHPQTQGKIERWHQTLKNRILLDNYYLPGDLERQIGAFVEHYNHVRYHESIDNLTPADVYFGRAETILTERQRIKRETSQTVACSIGCGPLKLYLQSDRTMWQDGCRRRQSIRLAESETDAEHSLRNTKERSAKFAHFVQYERQTSWQCLLRTPVSPCLLFHAANRRLFWGDDRLEDAIKWSRQSANSD